MTAVTKTATARPMTCPVCGDPITPGQQHKNTIYTARAGIPTSTQAHYPKCWAICHPQARHIPAQPALFAQAAA